MTLASMGPELSTQIISPLSGPKKSREKALQETSNKLEIRPIKLKRR